MGFFAEYLLYSYFKLQRIEYFVLIMTFLSVHRASY